MAVSEHACTTQSLVTVSVVSSVHLRLVPDGKRKIFAPTPTSSLNLLLTSSDEFYHFQFERAVGDLNGRPRIHRSHRATRSTRRHFVCTVTQGLVYNANQAAKRGENASRPSVLL